MSPPGRKRKHDPSIPAHIDQSKLPAGVYWDRTGNGRWYVLEPAEGRPKKRTIATRNVRLSELHALIEERSGIDRGSVGYVLDEFHRSQQFAELAPRTQSDYESQRKIAMALPTKVGKPLGALSVAKLSPAFVQRIVDSIAERTPTKANHLLRYLRRVFQWGVQRGRCASNPARGVQQARERKLRRLPDPTVIAAVRDLARERGALDAHTKGSCAPYLWIVMELAYLCRLRGIEVITLTDAAAGSDGVRTNRRKGSRDNVTRWSPRLRTAWDAAVALRNATLKRARMPVAIRPEARPLFVAESGKPLAKSSLDTAWQRLMRSALEAGVITPDQRFGAHDLKRRGITDTAGTRGQKQEASGHKNEAMLDVYDHSVPVVDPAGEGG